MIIICVICGSKVELEDTDETVDCDYCGYHYLEKCPICDSLYNWIGDTVEVFNDKTRKWDFFDDNDIEVVKKDEI